jgi:hypothetical protein
MTLTRSRFLRLGAATAIGPVLAAPVARAALPRPTPIGDDEGFLQFGALAERTSQRFCTRAAAMKATWSAGERRALLASAKAKAAHFDKLQQALGEDAPSAGDFAIVLPPRAFARRASALKLGLGLERLLGGVYLYGVAFTADPATRLLLGRLLAGSSSQLAWLQRAGGDPPKAPGLPDPLDLEAAGLQLDHYLKATTYPTT